jgi:hypothetical protein
MNRPSFRSWRHIVLWRASAGDASGQLRVLGCREARQAPRHQGFDEVAESGPQLAHNQRASTRTGRTP